MDPKDIERMYRIRMNGVDPRYARLNFLELCLKGKQYNEIPYDFFESADNLQQYIPLRHRRPAVVYNLAKIMVDRSTDMLFGDQHWPAIHIEGDKATEEALEIIVRFSDMKTAWRQAARMGSVGSVVIIFKIVDGKLYHEVLNAKDCIPTYHNRVPGRLTQIREKRQVEGRDLVPYGYDDLEPDAMYWYIRDFTEMEEIEYFPVKTEDSTKLGRLLRRNDARSFAHNLGFVPGEWVRNLPGDDPMDGESTFECVLPFQRELDYQISQIGRVFHYTGDPITVLKDPSIIDTDGTGEGRIRQAGNTIILNAEGDAFNLEVQAEAQRVNIEFLEKLRKYALEVGRGNRADPEKISSSQSGKALALLHKDLIGLVSELRDQYGAMGLVKYLTKILIAMEIYHLDYPELKGKKTNPAATLQLRWGDFFEPTSSDNLTFAQFLTEAITNGTISKESGTRMIAPLCSIADVAAERKRVEDEEQKEIDLAVKLGNAQQVGQQKTSKTLGVKKSAPSKKE
jgi:hypothetical protein